MISFNTDGYLSQANLKFYQDLVQPLNQAPQLSTITPLTRNGSFQINNGQDLCYDIGNISAPTVAPGSEIDKFFYHGNLKLTFLCEGLNGVATVQYSLGLPPNTAIDYWTFDTTSYAAVSATYVVKYQFDNIIFSYLRQTETTAAAISTFAMRWHFNGVKVSF